jgi:DNA-binding CsgD family transcriptional regulator
VGDPGWAGLFQTAFKRSRNPMVLLDEMRRHVDVNGAYIGLLGHPRTAFIGHPVYEFVADGPLLSPDEWRRTLARGQFVGQADLIRSDAGTVTVQYAAHTEVVTGKRLALFVVLETSRRGRHLPEVPPEPASPDALTARELQIVRMIADGSTSSQIAEDLHLSQNTVRTHVRNAMVKLNVRSRAHLVAKSLGDGIALA